ncbi:hypothetical protein CkaCkLH20_09093 [Colletotrichum karsti]|uniref:Uncharacterized protein n=1 Tax=Colletotrichum karsti TaxID=1095194 RepID=A0A9P6I782_9PEZI|nr:uncharacterized protein CkaCkLH20_09093 [Colletotrichum karsti]KAF9873280.1 hypothetical protein CkaCkLH20_09093 [Colletotrichum karsti]
MEHRVKMQEKNDEMESLREAFNKNLAELRGARATLKKLTRPALASSTNLSSTSEHTNEPVHDGLQTENEQAKKHDDTTLTDEDLNDVSKKRRLGNDV